MKADIREKMHISIIVPVYNTKAEYLRFCMDGLLKDASKELEIVIVDDKSSNGCDIICDEYVKTDSRVRVIHQPVNMGVSEARNTGIKESRGEWVVFVDSDDWLESDYLQVLSQHICSKTDIIMFSALREGVNFSNPFGTSDSTIIYSEEHGDESLYELRNRMLKQSLKSTNPKYDTVKYCWGKAFRRRFLIDNDIFFPELNYCEDIAFMCKAFQHASKVTQIPERLYHYRMTESSAVNSFRPDALTEQKKFLKLMQDSVNTDALFYVALLSMQICITRYLYHKDNKKSLLNKRKETNKLFSQYPYSDVFRHVKCDDMKRSERIKALLIKYKQYYLYYRGTQIMKIKKVSY